MSHQIVERHEDMTPMGRLRLIKQEDGDVIVAIVEDPNEHQLFGPSVEFCTQFGGGGKSPHTWVALRAMYEAMERDNRENPVRCRCCASEKPAGTAP